MLPSSPPGPLTVEQLVERDQYAEMIRDLCRFVVGAHAHAARGAVRIAFTWRIGDSELLIGHGDEAPDRVTLIIEGEHRHVMRLPADCLGVDVPDEPTHLDDTATALEYALAQLTSTHSPW